MEGKLEAALPILCPTRSVQGAMAQTVVKLMNTAYLLKRNPLYVQVSCHGYAFVRNELLKAVKELLPEQKIVRGFMIDDDILIGSEVDELLTAVQIADQNEWNIVAPYRFPEGHWSLCHPPELGKQHMFTDEEFQQGQPWGQVWGAGLGFYYGDIPLDYEFHSDKNPFDGEDLNFFHDLAIRPRVAPLELWHAKTVLV